MNPLTPLQAQTLNIIVQDTNSRNLMSAMQIAKKIVPQGAEKVSSHTVHGVIHDLRVKGYPILDKGSGYFYARKDFELKKFIDLFEEKLAWQHEMVEGLKNSYHNVGQVSGGGLRRKVKCLIRIDKENVAEREYDCGPDGKPIIPEGVILV